MLSIGVKQLATELVAFAVLVARDEEVDDHRPQHHREPGGPHPGTVPTFEKSANRRFGEFEQANHDQGADAQRGEDFHLSSAVGVAGVCRSGRPPETEQGENVGRGVQHGMERVRSEGERAGEESVSCLGKSHDGIRGPGSARRPDRFAVDGRRRRRAPRPDCRHRNSRPIQSLRFRDGVAVQIAQLHGGDLAERLGEGLLVSHHDDGDAGRSRYLRATRRTSSFVTAAIFAYW